MKNPTASILIGLIRQLDSKNLLDSTWARDVIPVLQEEENTAPVQQITAANQNGKVD